MSLFGGYDLLIVTTVLPIITAAIVRGRQGGGSFPAGASYRAQREIRIGNGPTSRDSGEALYTVAIWLRMDCDFAGPTIWNG